MSIVNSLLKSTPKISRLLLTLLMTSTASMAISTVSLADTINRNFTVSFGTQTISAPVRVSSVHPIVSKMVSLPAVNCGSCRGNINDYTYSVEWVSDQAYLDVERTNLIASNGGGGSQVWVFRPSAYTTGAVRNIETMIRHKGSIGGTNCDPLSLSNDFYQCKLTNKNGNAFPAIELEVGLLIIGNDVQPGDISTLDRELLSRVVTFKKGDVEIAKYKDVVKVMGNTTLASCNVNSGSLIFNLPARSINVVGDHNLYDVKSQAPSDAVRRELRLTCVGNTELNIQFTPMTGTTDGDKILQAKKSDGTNSSVGFQLWFNSSEWPGTGNDKLVKWDSQVTSLLPQATLSTPRPASAPDIIVNFKASYAIKPGTNLSASDAGAIVAKGMYTLSYQ
ncbi:MAG TPA: hypothetical protein DD649_09675 [Providencia sp.]|uniref:hypothetical protein n=1 Tax=Providencia sp. TaxID=589 RepID=UPI000E81B519|nr:hypothetical protein [Providencia sp.]MBP6080157.1 hypothetical protein [Providencia sp.]HBO23138.1 hypothetical protein [Providencia sp.]